MNIFSFIQYIGPIYFIVKFVKLINTCSHHHVIDYIRAFFTLIFGASYMYFYHVFQHKHNDSMLGKIHTAYHHNPKYKHIWYAKIIELFNNLQFLILILVNNLIKKFTNIEIFSNYILFYFMAIYVWNHFIEYHNIASCKHMYHHAFDNEENRNHSSEIKNYGPPTMDKIFNTYHDCNHEHDSLWATVRVIITIYIMYHATVLIFKIKQ